MEERPDRDLDRRGSYTRYGNADFDLVPLADQSDEYGGGGGGRGGDHLQYARDHPLERPYDDGTTWYDHGECPPEVKPQGGAGWGLPASWMGGENMSYNRVLPHAKTSIHQRPETYYYSPYSTQSGSNRLSSTSAGSYIGLLPQDPNSSHPWVPPYDGSGHPNRRRWQTFSRLSLRTKFNAYAIASALVLCTNLAFTITAAVKYGLEDGIGTLRQGSCSQIKKTDIGAHYGINFASTLLLSASNYCMQCLCAPTREEIDTAHGEREWLDIGVQSIRNLRKISGIRVSLWWCLSLSSVSLHLLYNSAIFDMLAANEYNVAVVSEDFLTGGKWNFTDPDVTSVVRGMREQSSQFTRLEKEPCVRAYGQNFVSDRNDVIVVSMKNDTDNALLGYLNWTYAGPQNSWVCNTNFSETHFLEPTSIVNSDCTLSGALEAIDSWVMAGEPVNYCLSRTVEENCKLQFSLHIMLAVIACNAVKSICMVLTGNWMLREKRKGQESLITVGDAVASFLQREDENTKGMCLLTKGEVEGGMWRLMPGERKWEPKKKFWFLACWKRWVGANVFCLVSLGLVGYLFSIALHQISVSEDIGTLWRLGFGTITPSALIPMKLAPLATNSLLTNVLIANLPQALVSVLYLNYNGVFTCMLVAKEWSRFADQRRGLRVTEPKGSQTSSYFLSLPYAYAVPLLVFSVTIHWLASQSIFLARIIVFSPDKKPDLRTSISTCGYSPIAIIFAMATTGLLVASNLALGFRRYRADIPLVGSCSVAISAACHRSILEGPDIAYKKVQWGVVRDGGEMYGHCAFSAKEVQLPTIGIYYAGESSDRQPGVEGDVSLGFL